MTSIPFVMTYCAASEEKDAQGRCQVRTLDSKEVTEGQEVWMGEVSLLETGGREGERDDGTLSSSVTGHESRLTGAQGQRCEAAPHVAYRLSSSTRPQRDRGTTPAKRLWLRRLQGRRGTKGGEEAGGMEAKSMIIKQVPRSL